MRAQRLGEQAVLVECADAAEVTRVYATLRPLAAKLGAVDVVPAARTVLLDGLRDVPAALAVLAEVRPAPPTAASPASRVVEIPTSYDGEDLDEVARQWSMTTGEVVRTHQQTTFTVLFCGFAPGFAYCTGLPEAMAVSRRPEPRPRVPKGSVGLAGEYTGVYPSSSPGGWQLIGTTSVELWRPGAEEPALLVPGTTVRFVDG